ncbi:MAG: indolepyruvate oxidoreductase subunit beta [Melioribacteraceae bacterium]|jgi:indolepyruvate ferredoxin oxidoreductase beta subunit|nr:indolepyruvate oxidoreductase subunit beta [Melioribacteraceae bacterium]
MKKDIILSGVGGQGILSIAAIIGLAAIEKKLFVKQSEVHGMSQRGGAVQSHLRISDKEIASDLIPYGESDIIISVEPMEALRYLPFLSSHGWIITSTTPFVNIPNYPDLDALLNQINSYKNVIAINADEVARRIKTPKASNVVILGAASPFLEIPLENLEGGIRSLFGRKGEEIINMNITALNAGVEESKKYYQLSGL